jgi:YdaS antitoxin of YdaST toxin-antitoxin system
MLLVYNSCQLNRNNNACQPLFYMIMVAVMDAGLKKAIAAAGNKSRLAELLKIQRQAISKWKRVPLNRILAVEAATGVRREELRPELYR